MAYFKKEWAAELRSRLRKEFPSKSGWKISVRVKDYQAVYVKLMSAPTTIEDVVGEHYLIDLKDAGYVRVNPHFINDNLRGELARFFNRVLELLVEITGTSSSPNDPYYHYSEYGDYPYYTKLSLGDFEKPIQFKEV